MPRQARRKSEIGIYHIILRGINQQTIFEDKEDYARFVSTLEKFKDISGYKVYSYCLMHNHIHILLKTGEEELDLIMKRIAGSYVYWYNNKYYRTGHLFQDRFRSEPVEDEAYLLTVIRYIHQNPLKAHLVSNIKDYTYSSYNEYLSLESTLVDVDFVLSMMDKDSFIEFNNEPNDDAGLDVDNQHFRINDRDAKLIIKEVSGCDNIADFSELTEAQQVHIITKLKKRGLSIRQISRLTGIKFSIVRKYK